MPNALTHYYIGETIFRGLDKETQSILDKYKKEYTLGCLGPDIIMGLMLDKEPLKRDAGEKLHTDFVYAGLCNTANYLARHKDDGAMYAYFLGFLTHYAADTAVHPYVYYYIENRMKQKFDPILNNCLHTIVETEMDVYVGNYLLNGKKSNSFYRFNTGKKRKDIVSKFFLEINKKVFGLILNKKDIKRSMFFFKLMMLICQRKNNGRIRFTILERIDKYIKAEHLLMSALRPRDLDKRYDYLNMDRMPYKSVYRKDDCAMVNHTFPEMLDIARDKGIKLIEAANRHIFLGEPLSIELFDLNYNGEFNQEYLEAAEAGLITLDNACSIPFEFT